MSFRLGIYDESAPVYPMRLPDGTGFLLINPGCLDQTELARMYKAHPITRPNGGDLRVYCDWEWDSDGAGESFVVRPPGSED